MRKPIPLEDGRQITRLQPINVRKWEEEKVAFPIRPPLDDDWFAEFHLLESFGRQPITFEVVEKVPESCVPFNVLVKGHGMMMHTYALATVEWNTEKLKEQGIDPDWSTLEVPD